MKNQIRQIVVVRNSQGLHARPADLLAKTAGQFESTVYLARHGEQVDAKSILAIMALAAESGTELEVIATGTDAQGAIDAVADLFARDFEEPGSSIETAPDSTN